MGKTAGAAGAAVMQKAKQKQIWRRGPSTLSVQLNSALPSAAKKERGCCSAAMEEGEEDEDDMFVGPPEREDSDFLVLWNKNYQARERERERDRQKSR